MRRMTLAGGIALAVSTFTLIAAPVAGATTYNNDTPIGFQAGGIATPYPSSIIVSGTAGPLTDVNVGLDGLTHAFPDDVSIVLVGPTGQALLLVNCAADGTDALGVFITLDDAAAGKLPDGGGLSSGTFQPTSHCNSTKTFPAPGPLTAYANPGPGLGGAATFASVFNGSSAIGTWNLYVKDGGSANGGTIPGGWSLDVKPDVTPLPPAISPPTITPTPAPASAKKKCKKKSGGKAEAAGKKKGCKKPKKRSG